MGKKSIEFSCFSTNQVFLPYFLTSLLHEAMRALISKSGRKFSLFFYLFFLLKRKKIFYFGRCHFFQPHFIMPQTNYGAPLQIFSRATYLWHETHTKHMHRPFNRTISSCTQPPSAPPASNQNHHRYTPAAYPSSTITAAVPLLSLLLQTTIEQWCYTAVGVGDTIKLGAVGNGVGSEYEK